MPDDALPTPARVLVVAAHPDDIEFGAAGTIARWVSEGAEIGYLIATRGDKGSDDPDADLSELVARREHEQRDAAAELGVASVDFLDEPDGLVQPTLALRERITRAIRRAQPEVVMSHDPTVLFVNNEWVNHPDHRAVGQVTVDAVFPTARDPLNFPEHRTAGLEPWKVAWVDLPVRPSIQGRSRNQGRREVLRGSGSWPATRRPGRRPCRRRWAPAG